MNHIEMIEKVRGKKPVSLKFVSGETIKTST